MVKRWRVSNGQSTEEVTATTEAAALRAFWKRLVARREPTYNGQTVAVEIAKGKTMANLTGEAKRKFLARMAAGRAKNGKKAGVTGKPVYRKKKTSKKKKPARGLSKRGSGMTSKKPAGQLGKGSPATRLKRVEVAVRDLAKANNAVVKVVVDHEKRLGHVESVARNWIDGRGR